LTGGLAHVALFSALPLADAHDTPGAHDGDAFAGSFRG
jgi:hypothetical protein